MKKIALYCLLVLVSAAKVSAGNGPGSRLSGKLFARSKTPAVPSVNNLLYKPGKSINFFWSDPVFGPGSWVQSGGSQITYTSSGKLATMIDTAVFFGNTSIRRETHSYDAQDRETEVLNEQYDNQNQVWNNWYRMRISYDQQGLLQEYIYESWQNNSWFLQGGFRDIRTYNGQNQITLRLRSSYSAQDSVWVNEGRTTDYQYDGQNRLISYTDQEWDSITYVNSEKVLLQYGADNRPNEAVLQDWNGTAFVDSSRITELQWHYWNGILETSEPLSFIEQKKPAAQWVNFEKQIFYYLENNSRRNLTQVFSGNAWKDASRSSSLYDEQLNLYFEGDEEYNSDLSRWDTLQNANYSFHSYDSQGRIQETISKQMSLIFPPDQPSFLSWQNTSRKLFSQHQVFTGMENLQAETFRIFPNPVAANGAFLLNCGEGSITLRDVQGRLIQSKEVSAGERISVKGMESGMYELMLRSRDGKIKRGRLVVQ